MKKTSTWLVFSALAVLVIACGKKEENKNIIVKKQTVSKAPVKTEKMEDVDFEKNVDWVGSVYKVSVRRFCDESLPMVEDEYGNKYYDNKITIQVTRKDGSEFFNRTFTKSDFSSCLNDDFRKNGALLGLVFTEADGDNLKFAGSIGSPDQLSDEQIPVVLILNRMGAVSIKRDNLLDTPGTLEGQDDLDVEEDGV